eukprot:CAMPEP_0117749838 /NCGR_PEP_ID=MMETSP0947-20121206/9972_1 /TAXON_ID=44440 /ORGANISM="Chattonella subsalsa, Strain CCMP2191" /LENGTH=672 /DNA_ID=CAMNT_0005567813 /DNA_START=38 /DNA_END=2056 /DNA_ORIENTATION=-
MRFSSSNYPLDVPALPKLPSTRMLLLGNWDLEDLPELTHYCQNHNVEMIHYEWPLRSKSVTDLVDYDLVVWSIDRYDFSAQPDDTKRLEMLREVVVAVNGNHRPPSSGSKSGRKPGQPYLCLYSPPNLKMDENSMMQTGPITAFSPHSSTTGISDLMTLRSFSKPSPGNVLFGPEKKDKRKNRYKENKTGGSQDKSISHRKIANERVVDKDEHFVVAGPGEIFSTDTTRRLREDSNLRFFQEKQGPAVGSFFPKMPKKRSFSMSLSDARRHSQPSIIEEKLEEYEDNFLSKLEWLSVEAGFHKTICRRMHEYDILALLMTYPRASGEHNFNHIHMGFNADFRASGSMEHFLGLDSITKNNMVGEFCPRPKKKQKPRPVLILPEKDHPLKNRKTSGRKNSKQKVQPIDAVKLSSRSRSGSTHEITSIVSSRKGPASSSLPPTIQERAHPGSDLLKAQLDDSESEGSSSPLIPILGLTTNLTDQLQSQRMETLQATGDKPSLLMSTSQTEDDLCCSIRTYHEEEMRSTFQTAPTARSLRKSMVPDLKNVLVVDDDRIILKLVSRMLAKKDFEVETAKNGVEGLDQLKSTSFRAAVIDTNMPVMDGRECIRQFREWEKQEMEADRRVRKQRIIMFSANAGAPDIEKAMQAGADAFVAKPVSIDELVAAFSDSHMP